MAHFALHTTRQNKHRHLLIVSLTLLLAAAICTACAASASQTEATAAATPTTVQRATTVSSSTPTTSPAYASSDGMFVYYGNCVDLDEGTMLGSTGADCEFVLQPKSSQALIDFIPVSQTQFSQLSEFSRQPGEMQCRRAETMSNSAQTINPQSGGYLCYRTGLGRYGYLRFMNSATNGLNITFLTYEEAGVEPGAVATATPVQVYSVGRDEEFQFGWYFDTDLGQSSKARLDDSDFAIRPVIGGNDLEANLQPVSPARFSVLDSAGTAPEFLACQAAHYPAAAQSREALTLQLPAYVCYQSSEGRYGYLYVHTRHEGGVLFDWRTFTPLFEMTSPATATPSPLLAEAEEERIYFRSYFDLDQGSQSAEETAGSDFLLYPGPGADTLHFELVPVSPASFTFSEMLYTPPDAQQCRLSPVFNSQAETIDPFGGDGSYLCYQTSNGYYGYLHFQKSDASSVTVDWHTFDPSADLVSPRTAATLEAAALGMQVPPAADPVWQDSFDNQPDWQAADENGKFENDDGSLLMTALHADNRDARIFAAQNISEYYLEAVFRSGPVCTSLDHYGLLFGGLDQGTDTASYLFGISCNGRYMLRRYDGENYETVLTWNEHELIRRGSGQRNRLGVLVQNERVVLYANGVLLAQVSELDQTGGLFGVFLGAVRTDFFQVSVEDIAYWAIGETESTPTTSQ